MGKKSAKSDRASIWEEVAKLEAAGKRPVIKIPAASRVIIRRPPGGQRTKPVGSHRHWHWKMKTAAGEGMSCRNYGCHKRIESRVEAITCSPACEEELRRYCEITLDVLTGKVRAREYPLDLRSRKSDMAKKNKRAA